MGAIGLGPLWGDCGKMNRPIDERLDEAFGYIRNQRGQIERLRGQVERLEKVLDLCLGDEDGAWLWKNRVERMDALVPVFDPLRSRFHLARYEFAAGYARDRIVADVACGTGYGCRTLAEKGLARHVEGFDNTPEAVRYAQRRYGAERVKFSVADAGRLPLGDDAVELVTSFETIEHVPSDVAVIAELARILRPGGKLICSTPNRWPLAIAPFHTKEYDLASFTGLLDQYFRTLVVYNQNSGTAWEYNHDQPAGLVPTTDANRDLAECYVAVCERL